MTSIKKDASKQKWEETEFPLVCETCLGDNPYVRMTKETHGKKCKICEVCGCYVVPVVVDASSSSIIIMIITID